MRLGVFTRIYDCPYFPDWFDAMRFQSDMDYELFLDLQEAVNAADFVLFTDIDDIPRTDFVENAKRFGAKHDVTGFSMTFIDHHGRKLPGTFGKPGVDLGKYNVYGLGNTVWRSSLLSRVLKSVDLYDWDMAREAERLGADMAFCHIDTVKYRRYGQNTSKLVKLGNRYVWEV